MDHPSLQPVPDPVLHPPINNQFQKPSTPSPLPLQGQRSLELKSEVNGPDISPTTNAPHHLLVIFTFTLLGITIYFLLHFWKKNRQRRIPALYKLEGYRYSRLNQVELDVDSVVFYRDTLEETQSELEIPETEDIQSKPATLHVETDSLINISNSTLTTPDRRGSLNSNFPNEPGKLEPGKLEPGKLLTLDEALEASDEDLLQ